MEEYHRLGTAPIHGMDDKVIMMSAATQWFGQLLSLARRQLEQESLGKGEAPSCAAQTQACAVPDVAPLGEGERGDLFCKDASGQAFWMENSPPDGVRIACIVLSRSQVPSLIAHLQRWLDTGSFALNTTSQPNTK